MTVAPVRRPEVPRLPSGMARSRCMATAGKRAADSRTPRSTSKPVPPDGVRCVSIAAHSVPTPPTTAPTCTRRPRRACGRLVVSAAPAAAHSTTSTARTTSFAVGPSPTSSDPTASATRGYGRQHAGGRSGPRARAPHRPAAASRAALGHEGHVGLQEMVRRGDVTQLAARGRDGGGPPAGPRRSRAGGPTRWPGRARRPWRRAARPPRPGHPRRRPPAAR